MFFINSKTKITMKRKSGLTEEQIKIDIETKTKVCGKFNTGDDISISLIQRKCGTGYFTAYRTLEKLIEDGFVKRGKTVWDVCKVCDDGTKSSQIKNSA